MRPSRPWLLAVVPLLAAACGASGASKEQAARIVAGDWSYNTDFPDRPELKGSTVNASDVRCRRLRDLDFICEVSAHLKDGRVSRFHVLARFDRSGALTSWDFVEGGKG